MEWTESNGREWAVQVVVVAVLVAACSEEPAPGGFSPAVTDPMTEVATQGLVVGGCQCPSWQPGVTCGELSYSDIPADDSYYITTFGGPGDGQDMWICGYKSTSNGSWAYMAGYERFGCGKVLVKHPSLDKYCVTEVADCGPNKCVEQAACFCGCGGHVPILDVSPFVTNHLFGITSSGWSEKREVIAWQVDASEAIGCFNGGVGPGTGTLKGVVYVAPDTADRIPGALVSLNTGQSTTADGVGYWEFELDPGTYTATASKAGYLSASQTRTVSAGATVWGSIGLSACSCSDGNPCTNDSCAGGVCNHTNNTNNCNDGNACTSGDKCSGGSCQGTDISGTCDDGNPCTDDTCQPATGCVHAPNSLPCDDGNACTTADHCSGGQCTGGGSLGCDDGNPCTDDGCTPPGGCTSAVNAAPCDDGDACTGGDVCEAGACTGLDISSACGDGNPCTDDACDPASGCLSIPNTSPCDDGNACTEGDACAAGVCVGAGWVLCDDGNPCTEDACSPDSGGCAHAVMAGFCDDGDACTWNDHCVSGVCQGGERKTCVDGNPCTDDLCQPTSGACIFPPNSEPCDDGDPCTDGDLCEEGFCVGELLPACADIDVVEESESEVLSEPEVEPGYELTEGGPSGADSGPEGPPSEIESDPDPRILQGPTAGGCDTTPGGAPIPLGVLLIVVALAIIRRRIPRWT